VCIVQKKTFTSSFNSLTSKSVWKFGNILRRVLFPQFGSLLCPNACADIAANVLSLMIPNYETSYRVPICGFYSADVDIRMASPPSRDSTTSRKIRLQWPFSQKQFLFVFCGPRESPRRRSTCFPTVGLGTQDTECQSTTSCSEQLLHYSPFVSFSRNFSVLWLQSVDQVSFVFYGPHMYLHTCLSVYCLVPFCQPHM
jgi:hypothetical protein